ncbi:hypothetical protein [Dactylosporangium sp. CA-233914]|uniref:hypothetical protein n=1 Tax=Dactylosporangium sp. CA-233914 TaxID=3239934 RepID=UPI003D89FF95
MITGVRAPEHRDLPGSGETVPTMQDLVTFAMNRSSSADRATALAGLVPFLTEDQLTLVLDAGLQFEDELDRCRVMDAVVPRATPAQLPRILAGALRLREPGTRTVRLASLIPHLPEADRDVAVEAATAAAERAHPMSLIMSNAVVTLAPWCTPTQLERIVAAAVAVGDEALRPHLLTRVAEFLSGRLLDETVRTICAIADGNLRAVTLTGLAPAVTGEHLAAVEDAAHAIEHGSAHARALAGVAPHLPGPRRQAAITAALAAAAGQGSTRGPGRLCRRLRSSAGLRPHQALRRAVGDRASGVRGPARPRTGRVRWILRLRGRHELRPRPGARPVADSPAADAPRAAPVVDHRSSRRTVAGDRGSKFRSSARQEVLASPCRLLAVMCAGWPPLTNGGMCVHHLTLWPAVRGSGSGWILGK